MHRVWLKKKKENHTIKIAVAMLQSKPLVLMGAMYVTHIKNRCSFSFPFFAFLKGPQIGSMKKEPENLPLSLSSS